MTEMVEEKFDSNCCRKFNQERLTSRELSNKTH